MRGNDAWEGKHLIDEENIIFRVSFRKPYVLSIHSTQKQAWSLAFERSDFKLKPLFKHLLLRWEGETAKESNLSLPFLALLCTRELDSRAVSGLVYLCLPPVGICFSSRDGHAQRMKLVQDEFLTIASGHCWGPEPGPWVTVYCCGADWAPGAPAKPTHGDRVKSSDISSSASPRGVKTLQAQRQRGVEKN